MKRVRIAVVGLNFGKAIVRQLSEGPAREWFDLVALADLDLAKAQTMAEPLGAKAYPSLDELLARQDLDCVALITAPVGRAKLIDRILDAGKHVLTTKPFERDANEARRVLARARRLGLTMHVNSPSPILAPDLAQIAAWREQYHLGRPVGARAEVTANYSEQPDGGWLDDDDACPCAPLYRLGIYQINDLLQIFGPVQTVQVTQSRLRTRRPTTDNAMASLLFANGAIGSVYATFCAGDGQHYRNRLALNFEHGTVYRELLPVVRAAHAHSPTLTLVTLVDGNPVEQTVEVPFHSGAYCWRELADTVAGKPLPNATDDAIIVQGVEVINALARAARSGQTETVA